MTDISKEAVERGALRVVDWGCGEDRSMTPSDIGQIIADSAAQAARIEELEADVEHLSQFLIDTIVDLATARNDALKEAAGVAYAACADTRHVKMGLSVEKNILALMTKEPNT